MCQPDMHICYMLYFLFNPQHKSGKESYHLHYADEETEVKKG